MRRVVCLIGAIAAFAVFPLSSWATCSNSLMSGSWGGYAYGTIPGGALANSVNLLHFDGNGNFTSLWFAIQNQTFNGQYVSGTYSVSTDSYTGSCYGTLVPSSGTGGTFVLSTDNSVAYYLNEVSGANLSAVWTKQSLSECATSAISGTYGGYTFGTNPGNHLDNGVSAWFFDGNGNYEQSWWSMQSGSYQSGTAHGTYVLSTDSTTGVCYGAIIPTGSTTSMLTAIGGTAIYFIRSTNSPPRPAPTIR